MNDIFNKYIMLFKKPKVLIMLGVIGLIFVLLSSMSAGDKKKTDKNQDKSEITVQEYKAELEECITKTVREITGSRRISVVVTLESGIKYSYADIREENTTEKKEKENITSDNELKEGYITVKNSDGGEEALLVTAEMPQVRGVAIVCDGGDNEYIAEKIQNAVTAALDITSKRVYICGRNT